jgi:hypothetical protein
LKSEDATRFGGSSIGAVSQLAAIAASQAAFWRKVLVILNVAG